MTHLRSAQALGLTLAAVAIACQDTNAPPPINSIVTVEGLNQSAATGEVLPAPVTVELLRQNGAAASNIELTWTLDSNGGALAAEGPPTAASTTTSLSTRTSADGRASVWWRLGATEEDHKLTVTATASPTIKTDVAAKSVGVLAVRYNGTTWTKELLDTSAAITEPSLTSVAEVSPSSIMAVGTYCTASTFLTPTTFLVLRNDGSTWNPRGIVWERSFSVWSESGIGACPAAPISIANVTAVAGRSTIDVFMLTRTRVSQQQQLQIRHFDGARWTSQYSYGNGLVPYGPLNGIWLDSDKGAYVVTDFSSVNTGTDPNEGGTIKRYDGTTWTTIYVDGSKGFDGIWGVSPSDITVVGTDGTILHFDGSTWTLQASGTTANLRAVRVVSSTSAFAVGDGGVAVRYDRSNWTSTIVNPGLSFQGI